MKQGSIQVHIWSWKKKNIIWVSSMSESHWWYLFYELVRSLDSGTWCRIWQFRTLAKKRYLQMHLLAEGFVFWEWWSGFFSEGVSRPIKWHQCRFLTFLFFCCLHIYSLCIFVDRHSTPSPSCLYIVHGFSEICTSKLRTLGGELCPDRTFIIFFLVCLGHGWLTRRSLVPLRGEPSLVQYREL